MGRNEEAWAVFWCSLLSPVLLGEIPEAERERYFQELSQQERELPNGKRKRISVRTFRRQWRRLKDEGVSGLYRRRRSDRGQPRNKHADLLARAVELKKEQPYRDPPSVCARKVINRILQREFGRTRAHTEGGSAKHALSSSTTRRSDATQAGRLDAESPLPLVA